MDLLWGSNELVASKYLINGNSKSVVSSAMYRWWEVKGRDGNASRAPGSLPGWKNSSLSGQSRRQSLISASHTAVLLSQPQWNPHSILGVRFQVAKTVLVLCLPCREPFLYCHQLVWMSSLWTRCFPGKLEIKSFFPPHWFILHLLRASLSLFLIPKFVLNLSEPSSRILFNVLRKQWDY